MVPRYKLSKKRTNKHPKYQYWGKKKEEDEREPPKPIPAQQPLIQQQAPVQYPRYQLIIEDPRLAIPLQFMTRDGQENQPQKPTEDNNYDELP